MIIPDKLYKQIEISEPVIEQLIHTKAFLRLKEINQYGGINLFYPDKYQVTRYQHSLGVYHVLKTMGTDLETQIAGLLHDIGHTALSHMYEMALNSHTEDIHEQIAHKLEGWEDIEKILRDNNLKIAHPKEYSLIKKDLPDISADRFDYALRDYFFATNEFSDLPTRLLDSVSIDAEGLHFKSLEDAKKFGEIGNKAMRHVIYEPVLVIVYQSIIEIIRIGLNKGWLTEVDFLKTDKHVISKIMQNKNEIPEKYTKVFTEKYIVEETTEEHYDFKFVKLKSRYFDPRIKLDNKSQRVSELDVTFKTELDEYVTLFERAKLGIYYKIEFV